MPSLSISNDHGKSFTRGLATIEGYGAPVFSISSIGGVYSASPSLAIILSDTSLLSSQVFGQPSGVFLSGRFKNRTTKNKERFNFELTFFATIGNMVLLSGSATLESMGITNPSSGDAIETEFIYTLDGAYTSKGDRTSTSLS